MTATLRHSQVAPLIMRQLQLVRCCTTDDVILVWCEGQHATRTSRWWRPRAKSPRQGTPKALSRSHPRVIKGRMQSCSRGLTSAQRCWLDSRLRDTRLGALHTILSSSLCSLQVINWTT